MDLSILVISWNTLEMTRACLASVFEGLGGLSAEVILVDNASDDGSAAMVEAAFPQVRLIRNDRNRGFAAANNQAIAESSGRHVLLLNSDTLVRGDVLPASVAFLDAHPDAGAMGCKVLNTDGSVQENNVDFPSLPTIVAGIVGLRKLGLHRPDPERETDVDVVAGCYLMVRRAVIEQVGILDERFFFFGEETDWCRRMRDAGWRVVYAPVGEITHHGGGSVKRLNHRRDVMLSEATIRLQRKYNGWAGGVVAFILIFAFNFSRALFWSLLAPVLRSDRARGRAAHFRSVVAMTPATWPGPLQ